MAQAPLRQTAAHEDPRPPGAAQSLATNIIAPFRHNPLHDMESLTWLSYYLLLINTLVESGSAGEAELRNYTQCHRGLARRLFSNQATRRTMMSNAMACQMITFDATLDPQAQAIIRHLGTMVSSLITAYSAAEETLETQIPFTVAEDNQLYDAFDDQLDHIIDLLLKQDIHVTAVPDSDDPLREDVAPGMPGKLVVKSASVDGVVRPFTEPIENSSDRGGTLRGVKKAKV